MLLPTPQVVDNRQRLVESGAGPHLAKLAADPGYDSRTRAAAGSLWWVWWP